MPHDFIDDGVPLANGIAAGCCEHGAVTLELYDHSGNPIARAAMPMSSFAGIVTAVTADLNKHGLKPQFAKLQ